MATDEWSKSAKSMNNIFKEAYADRIKDLIPGSEDLFDRIWLSDIDEDTDLSRFSTRALENFLKSYPAQKRVRKELEKRKTPLYKTLRGEDE